MKNLFKLLLSFWILSLGTVSFAQTETVTVTNGVITLKGKGKLGGNKDGYQYYQYNTSVSGSFYLQAYFRNLSNKTQSYTGLALRNVGTYNRNDGGIASLMIVYQNDSLKIYSKPTYNQKAVLFLASANIKLPGYLRIEKFNNDAKFYYSNQPESDVAINMVSLGSIQNAFTGWTNITQNFITGSDLGTVQTAIVSKRTFGAVDTTPPAVYPPTLACVPTNPLAYISTTFTASGCTGTVSFYRNSTQVISGNPLTVSLPNAGDIYTAKCTVGGVLSGSSNAITIGDAVIVTGGAGVNTVPDMTIADYDKWNYFNPDDIGDVVIPKSIDPKSGALLPNKWFIWHAPYRNLFGLNNTESERLTKMFRKGVTAINASKLPTYYSGLESIITPDRIVGDGGLGENGGNPWPQEQSYTAFGEWAQSSFGYANSYHQPFVNGKYNILASIVDYENLSTKLINQVDANRHTVGLHSMLKLTTNFVGFQYGLGQNTGGYYLNKSYNGGTSNVWALPADNTVPSEFVGKSAASSNQILGIIEITYPYETFLPEGTVTKDQYGNNWFTIRHFGAECDNTYSVNSTANTQHWLTNIGVGTETSYNIHRAYPNGGQHVVVQLKPVSETDDGFHYGPIYSQFRDNKYIQEYARYGITQLGTEYNPDGSVKRTFEYLNAPGSEYLPPFIAEGQVYGAYTCGAKGINLWSSDFTDTAIPKPKAGNPRRGAKYNDVNYGNRDLIDYTYILKAQWRMAQKATLSDGRQFSFFDLCDGTEIYLNQNTKVIYPGSTAVTQLRALDWQLQKHTPVRAIVNVAKRAVAVYAAQAYGVEDNTVRFIYNENGANIDEVISVPAGKHIMKIFPFTAGTVVVDNNTVNPVTISANPTAPKAGTSVTFSSTACSGGTVKWYNADAQVSTGLTYTVASPVVNNIYTATCTVGTNVSVASNAITIAAAPVVTTGVTITEPSQAYLVDGSKSYYFSDGHAPSWYDGLAHNPSIFTNQPHYDSTADFVWMKNNKIKVGINLKRGGQLAWLSTITSNVNLVYNGYDGGFQVTMDAYQKPDGYTQNGKTSRSGPQSGAAITSYNTTMGGDFNNHSQSVIDYHKVGNNGYYVKIRPIFYTMDSELSRTYIAATYTLDGNSVKCDYTYTSFRDDNQANTGTGGFDGGHAPACFIINKLKKYKTYTGNQPWTRSNRYDVEDGNLPNETLGQSDTGTPLTKQATERWAMVYDPTNLTTVAIYAHSNAADETMQMKRKEVYDANGGIGTEFEGGYTYFGRSFDLVPFLTSFDRSNFTKSVSASIVVADSNEAAINEIYRISGH